MLEFVRWLVFAFVAYLVIGLIFAATFVSRGVHRIDPAADGAGWGFRALILPGSALFWPLLWHRWARPGRRRPSFGLTELPTDEGLSTPTATAVPPALIDTPPGSKP